MNIGAAFVPDGETTKAVEPGQRALDDPAIDAEATAVGRPATCEQRSNPWGAQATTMRFGVVASVALERVGLTAWAAGPTPNGWQRGDHQVQMGDVIDVGGGHLRDERDAARVGDEMVFGTRLAAIGWVR